jgi:hypothetical protein
MNPKPRFAHTISADLVEPNPFLALAAALFHVCPRVVFATSYQCSACSLDHNEFHTRPLSVPPGNISGAALTKTPSGKLLLFTAILISGSVFGSFDKRNHVQVIEKLQKLFGRAHKFRPRCILYGKALRKLSVCSEISEYVNL